MNSGSARLGRRFDAPSDFRMRAFRPKTIETARDRDVAIEDR
jgi:hypothetical protein